MDVLCPSAFTSFDLCYQLFMLMLCIRLNSFSMHIKSLNVMSFYHAVRCTCGICCVSGVSKAVLMTTGLTPLQDILSKQRASLFGHVAQLKPDVPAHQALRIQTDLFTGRNPDADGDGHLVDHKRLGAVGSGLTSECHLVTTGMPVEWSDTVVHKDFAMMMMCGMVVGLPLTVFVMCCARRRQTRWRDGISGLHEKSVRSRN